jgi:DNA-binding MarR family transcriptional regulator
MIEPFNSEFLTPTKKYRRLSVLLAIHDTSKISQHRMAEMTHLSSSMVNNYIKELQQEGLISVTGKTNRNHRYHLTSSGRKVLISSLLAYSSEIIQLYGGAKRQLAKRLHGMYEEGIRNVALYGAAETAEVVLAAMKETPLTVAGIVDSDPAKQGKAFNGLQIGAPKELNKMGLDAVVITSFGKQEEIYECVRKFAGNEIRVRKLSDL